MRPTKLTQDIINEIERYRRVPLTWKDIAHAIDVSPRTLRNWRKAAKTAETGLKKELRLAIARPEAGLIAGAAATMNQAATAPERMTKRTEKRTFDADGKLVKTEETTVYSGPSETAALIILERKSKHWAPQTTENQHLPTGYLSPSQRDLERMRAQADAQLLSEGVTPEGINPEENQIQEGENP